MAQITENLYMNYAYYFHLCMDAVDGADDFLNAALNAVVDLTSGTTGAVDIELALLTPTYQAYVSFGNAIASTSQILTAVRAINNYVINNSTSSSTTNDAKLADFVNGLTWNAITGDAYVPCKWEELSLTAGYDTSLWTSTNPSC